MKLLHIVGARPNFPKLAPVYRACCEVGAVQTIVHTGQHYDEALSGAFFRLLGIPQPSIDLGVGSHSHAVQTARIMERFEPILLAERPDWLLVYGDVNSTLAGALVASKVNVRIAHVEAGLRSGDRDMPEEINRIVTDRLSDLLLTPSRDADERLRREGEPDSKIEFVGNVMVDSLLRSLPDARHSRFFESLELPQPPVLVTLHRPSNIDDEVRLRLIADSLRQIADEYPVIFPMHPRTRARMSALAIDLGKVTVLAPVGYLEMLSLTSNARAVVTDSGGLQEETTVLGIRCFTLRDSTERPVTLTEGTNELILNPMQLIDKVRSAVPSKNPRRPEGWDGRASIRIAAALADRRPRAANGRAHA